MRILKYIFLLIYLFGIVLLTTFIRQGDGIVLVSAFIVCFVSGAVLVYKRSFSVGMLIGLGFVARLLCFFHLPSLSDDFYRFVWDGYLLNSGSSPYRYRPIVIEHSSAFLRATFPYLNSPEYYSVYPPFLQNIFGLAQWIAGPSVEKTVIVLRIIYFLAEGLSLFLGLKILRKLNLPDYNIFFYWLNPLVIVEIVGNLHPEGLVVPCILAGIYYYIISDKFSSGLFWGLAIGIKLNPVILLLPLVKATRKKWELLAGVTIPILLTGLLLYRYKAVSGMADSLDLYFRTFEFNASFYYLFREIAYLIYGYNVIAFLGPAFAILSIVAFIAILSRKMGDLTMSKLISISIILWMIYLFFSTTVHPWYIIPIISLSMFTQLRSPLIWSLVIVFSYMHYVDVSPMLYAVSLIAEYLILALAIYIDIKRLTSNSG